MGHVHIPRSVEETKRGRGGGREGGEKRKGRQGWEERRGGKGGEGRRNRGREEREGSEVRVAMGGGKHREKRKHSYQDEDTLVNKHKVKEMGASNQQHR